MKKVNKLLLRSSTIRILTNNDLNWRGGLTPINTIHHDSLRTICTSCESVHRECEV